MLKQRVHLIQTFTTSCQIHQKLKYSSRRMFSNKDQRPSDDAPFKKNIESKNYFESEYPKLKSYGSHFLIVVGALASGAAIYEAYRKYQEPLVRKPFKNFKDPDYQLPLPKKEMLLEDIINSGRLNSFLKKDIPLLFEKQSGLYVIVGESGIGKTEAFKSFVNEWKKRGTPGNFVSCQPNTTITTFLEKCFETSNEAEIDEEVQRWRRLEEAPLLVVDDIHKIYKDGKFESGILDFLKNFSDLGGKVFLLSSVSDVSYKIPHYSGYASRAYIFEIRPRDKPTMERYIREKINPLLGIRWSNEEIALFVDYFDGNIAMTKKLTQIATGQQDAQFQSNVLLNNNNLLH